ncbi:MAG: T9SS type A sorting domain-containing protein, partial [bacterium]
PTTGNFILELKGEIPADEVRVDVYGIRGEKVLTGVMGGERKHEFSLLDRPVGIYFIRVITGSRSETAKIIKQ